MSDGNVSLVPDVIMSTSDAIQANVPETAKQADGALSTVVGFFNNVVLYPVKKANLTFRYKLEAFEDDLKRKIANVPNENLQVPPTVIAGPTLEALKYTYDEKELREMYENLLASAMDNRIACHAHPAFVDAIKQMSPLDAKVMSVIAEKVQLRCGKIVFDITGTGQVYHQAMPQYFLPELIHCGDPFDISASITNLNRLGLIEIVNGKWKNTNYEELKSHPYVAERKEMFTIFNEPFEVELTEQGIGINDYGLNFVEICLRKETPYAH